jgi:hypothetical protein
MDQYVIKYIAHVTSAMQITLANLTYYDDTDLVTFELMKMAVLFVDKKASSLISFHFYFIYKSMYKTCNNGNLILMSTGEKKRTMHMFGFVSNVYLA